MTRLCDRVTSYNIGIRLSVKYQCGSHELIVCMFQVKENKINFNQLGGITK